MESNPGTPRDATSLLPQDVYRQRFEGMLAYRRRMWEVLCADFFQRYVPEPSTVLEAAAGYCEFINSIRAARKIAVDINPDTRRHAAPGVEVLLTPTTDLGAVPDGSVDVAFASNYFEHIPRPDIVGTLREFHRILRPGGSVLILQPNIRYLARDYWMFFDHVTPVDDRALCEVLGVCGFRVQRCIPRFLPYTTQSRLPKSLLLIRCYLRVPLLWRLFGGQAFVHATKT